MSKNVLILGAGGHAKVVAEIILKSGDEVVGFLDDNSAIQSKEIYLGKKVIGTIKDCMKYEDTFFVIGIGNNQIREKLATQLHLKWYTAIHPNSIIASDVTIGEGSVVMPGAIINPGTKIGRHCIINTSTSIDHDNILEDYVHISPGGHLAGTVTVKKGTWIGAGATVINNVEITEKCMIGAGAVVIKNILESGTYIGVPAKRKD